MTDNWVTIAQLAEFHDLSAPRVLSIAKLVGVAESRVHARRTEEGLVELSGAAAALVSREILSRGAERRPPPPLLLEIGHAWNACSRGRAAGGDHLLLIEPLERGRLVRARGDALCKPIHRFSALEPNNGVGAVAAPCTKCSAMAARHKLRLPEGWPTA